MNGVTGKQWHFDRSEVSRMKSDQFHISFHSILVNRVEGYPADNLNWKVSLFFCILVEQKLFNIILDIIRMKKCVNFDKIEK